MGGSFIFLIGGSSFFYFLVLCSKRTNHNQIHPGHEANETSINSSQLSEIELACNVSQNNPAKNNLAKTFQTTEIQSYNMFGEDDDTLESLGSNFNASLNSEIDKIEKRLSEIKAAKRSLVTNLLSATAYVVMLVGYNIFPDMWNLFFIAVLKGFTPILSMIVNFYKIRVIICDQLDLIQQTFYKLKTYMTNNSKITVMQ